MNVLITGATGFIGSHLAEKLTANGHKVTCLARKSSDTGFLEKIGAKIVYGNLFDIKALAAAVKGTNVVYHLAASREHGMGAKEIFRINVEGTRSLLEECIGKVKHFVFCSTIFVDSDLTPTSYSESKKAAEKIVKKYGENGLRFTIIRPTVVYGERDTNGLMTRLAGMIKHGKYFIVGNGKNKLSLIYVKDLATAFALVGANKNAFGKVFPVCSKSITLDVLSGKVATNLGKKIFPIKIPLIIARLTAIFLGNFYKLLGIKKEPALTIHKLELMATEQAYGCPAIKKLGFEANIGYDEGINRTVKWFVENKII